jgi:hypothetical protein
VVTKGGLSQPLGYFDDDSRHVKLRRSADRLPVPQMIEYGTGVVFHVIMTSAADRQGMLDALGRHPDRTTGRAGGGRGTGGFPDSGLRRVNPWRGFRHQWRNNSNRLIRAADRRNHVAETIT